MYSTHLAHASHTRTFTVHRVPEAGWEVVEEADDRVVRRTLYQDWHRVERALVAISAEVRALEREGWTPVAR